MSITTTTGTGTGNIATKLGYNTYFHAIYPTMIFSELSEIFKLDLPKDKTDFLNELYSTGEESNKKIAYEIFKYLLNNKSNDNSTESNNTSDNS